MPKTLWRRLDSYLMIDVVRTCKDLFNSLIYVLILIVLTIYHGLKEPDGIQLLKTSIVRFTTKVVRHRR